EAITLTLFRIGAGLLTIRVRPQTREATEWLDFLHYCRFMHGQRRVGVQIQRRPKLHQQTPTPQPPPLFPEPAGGVARHDKGKGCLKEVLDAVLRTGATNDETTQWWKDVFVPNQLLPYAALFVDAVPQGEIAELIYRVRNFFFSRQEIHP